MEYVGEEIGKGIWEGIWERILEGICRMRGKGEGIRLVEKEREYF